MFKYVCTIIFLSNCFYGYTAEKKAQRYGKVKEALPFSVRFNEACNRLVPLQNGAQGIGQKEVVKQINLAKKGLEEWEKKDLPKIESKEAAAMLKKGWDMVFNPMMWHTCFDGNKKSKDLIKLTQYGSEFYDVQNKAQKKGLPVPYKCTAFQNIKKYRKLRLSQLHRQGIGVLKDASVL